MFIDKTLAQKMFRDYNKRYPVGICPLDVHMVAYCCDTNNHFLSDLVVASKNYRCIIKQTTLCIKITIIEEK